MGRPLTPETLIYGLVQAGDPQLSPAGDAIVFTRTAVDGATKRSVGPTLIASGSASGATAMAAT